MAKKKEDVAAAKAEEKAKKAAAKKAAAKEAAASADPNKKKKKKTYTIDEILAAGDAEMEGKNGDRKKVHVKTHSKLKAREARMGYLFALPYIIGIVWLSIYPIFSAFKQAFTRTTDFRPLGLDKVQVDFIGWEAFQTVFQYEVNLISDFLLFVFKMILATPLIVVFALLMAMLLNTKIKGTGIFRTIFFLPVIVVSGPVMTMLLGSSVVNVVDTSTVVNLVTGSMPSFLADAITYVFENIVMFLWYSGVQILIFLSALQKIDTAMYEAAKIDGASGWECFWKITLPTIRPFIVLNGVYTLIALSQDSNINAVVTKIETLFYNAATGRDYFAAYTIMYTLVVLVLTILVAVILMPKRDIYAKQIAKNKRMEKKTKRNIKKTERRMLRNAKKYDKHLAKQAELKAKGKLKEREEGGRLDG